MVFVSSQIPQLRERLKEAEALRYPKLAAEPVEPLQGPQDVQKGTKTSKRACQGNPWLETWQDGFFVPRYKLEYPECPVQLPEEDVSIPSDVLHVYTQLILAWSRHCEDINLEYGIWIQTEHFAQRRWIADARRGCPKWRRGYCGAQCRDGSPCAAPVTPHGTRCQRHGGAGQEKAFAKLLQWYEDLHKQSTRTYAHFAPITETSMRHEDEGKPHGRKYRGFKRECRGKDTFAVRRLRARLRVHREAEVLAGLAGPSRLVGVLGDFRRRRYAELVKEGMPHLAELVYGVARDGSLQYPGEVELAQKYATLKS
jgi:hypothetical protein